MGASSLQILINVIIPLCLPGIAIGTIFVVSLIMGDFITVQAMSGGQSASVGLAMNNKRALLQYPAAAADAIILLFVVLGMVAILMRTINIRKEL